MPTTYRGAKFKEGSWHYPDGRISSEHPEDRHKRLLQEGKQKDDSDFQNLKEPPTTYRGTWLDRELMELIWARKLKPRELILLATIDSLTSRTRGCWASNAYLAELVGFDTEMSASKVISKLRKMGLVKQISFDGRRRILMTKWSRIQLKKSKTDTD